MNSWRWMKERRFFERLEIILFSFSLILYIYIYTQKWNRQVKIITCIYDVCLYHTFVKLFVWRKKSASSRAVWKIIRTRGKRIRNGNSELRGISVGLSLGSIPRRVTEAFVQSARTVRVNSIYFRRAGWHLRKRNGETRYRSRLPSFRS